MADTARRLSGPSTLTAGAVTQYTVPGATIAIVRHIHVCNRTTGDVTFTLSVGVDAAGTRLYDAFTIPPKGVLDWSGFLVLAAGEIIQAFAGAGTSLTLSISGVEVA